MFLEILGESGMKFAVAAVVVLLGLLCLALVLWIIRGRPSSPFIRGGRNRTPRLAVLDAAAIDTRRRLVLLRRDDVEHLVMIGGPTDIVIETRIVSASAEGAQPVERPQQKAEHAEPAPVLVETPAKVAETPIAARSAATTTATAASAATERRQTAVPDGVSAMSKVLYAGDEAAVVRPTPARTVSQPAAATQQGQSATQQIPSERRVEELLEQNRQRVLSPQVGVATTTAQAAAGQLAQHPATSAAIARPAGAVADPALVSEFEKLLEAEMASSAASTGATRTSVQPVASPTQTAAMAGQAQPASKSREETEAEMARLLGEIAANRKA